MAFPTTIEQTDVSAGDTSTGDGWIVTVFDNDTNTVEEVVEILIKATSCTLAEAEMETWEVHHLGKSVVHYGQETECKRTATVISEIGIRVEVSQE